jgi:hypothetical protein
MLSLKNDLLIITNHNGQATIDIKDEPERTKNIIRKEVNDQAAEEMKRDAIIRDLYKRINELTQDSLE